MTATRLLLGRRQKAARGETRASTATSRQRQLAIHYAVARASWTATACPRARARDERGSEATERIGWGGCGEVVSGCCAVVLVVQILPHTYRIGWGGCGEVVSGCCAVAFVTDLPTYTYRIGWGGCGGNWCPGVVRSHSSRNRSHTRTKSAGEDVTVRRARLSRSHLVHTATITHV